MYCVKIGLNLKLASHFLPDFSVSECRPLYPVASSANSSSTCILHPRRTSTLPFSVSSPSLPLVVVALWWTAGLPDLGSDPAPYRIHSAVGLQAPEEKELATVESVFLSLPFISVDPVQIPPQTDAFANGFGFLVPAYQIQQVFPHGDFSPTFKTEHLFSFYSLCY